MAEDKNTGKNSMNKEQIADILGKISNKLSEKAEEKVEKFKVPSLRFQEISGVPYENIKVELEEKAETIKETYGIDVKLIDNIDIKDGSNEKFYIKLTDSNGNTTTIDLLHYQRNIYDYSVNEEESIKNQILKLKGIYDKNIVDASKEIADYISLALGYKEAFHYQYKLVGWDSINNKVIFKYDKIYSKTKHQIKGFCGEEWAEALELNQKTEETKNKALSDWLSLITETFNNKPKADIVLSAAVSGLVRQVLPYTKETNINLNIVGQKASGKSTMQHLLLGFFGDPQYLEGSFYDSDNANEKIRAERVVIPFILDERMLKVEGQSEKKKAYNIILDIFKEYEGKVKQRVNGGNSSGLRTYGAVISSSVDSIFDKINEGMRDKNNNIRDLGQYRRFIEITMSREDFFNDGNIARKAENIAYTKYGYGVRLVIGFMMKMMKNYDLYNICLNESNSVAEAMERAYINFTHKINDEEYELEYDNRESFEVFSLLFDSIVEEIRSKMHKSIDKYTQNKNEYVKYISEIESSAQRFALLILTAHIINYSLREVDINNNIYINQINSDKGDKSSKEVKEYKYVIDTNNMLLELIYNAFDKIEDSRIFEHSYNVDGSLLGVKLYDWFEKYSDYCNKFNDKEFLACYEKKGNKVIIKLQKSTLRNPRKINIGILLANTDATPEEILKYENGKGTLKHLECKPTLVNNILNGEILKQIEPDKRHQLNNLNNRDVLIYEFNIDAIKQWEKVNDKVQLEKENKSQEESDHETN